MVENLVKFHYFSPTFSALSHVNCVLGFTLVGGKEMKIKEPRLSQLCTVQRQLRTSW